MKKILLTHSYFLRFDPKQWEIMQPYAPLGTIYAAAVLRKNGYEVSLFDPMFSSSAEEIIPSLKSFKPDALVIYDDGFNYLTKMCLTNMREAAFRMSELAKNSGIPVLVSGSDAADHFEKYLDHGAMAVIRGEGEFTLTETLNQYFGGNHDFSAIDGLSFRKSEKTVTNKPREVFKDLDEIPLPAWDLVDVETYKQAWLKKNGYFSMNMSTTRGCPFKCNWCAKPIYGNRYNSRSAENVVQEIQLLKKNYNPDHIWFCDDIFGLKPGWVNRFSELVKEHKINIRYKIQSRVDLLLQENNIEDLAKSGCDTVWFGAESGSQKILDAMDKGTKVEQIKEATILLKKHGIKPAFFLQFGYPGETEEDIQKTIAMVKELLPDDIGISVSYPLPGTKFYENVKHELKEKANWTDSDELALMFRNTYPSEYYKHLHRYVHKIYRRHQGAELLKNMVQGKQSLTKQNLKRAAGIIYHIPGELRHRKQMKNIASHAPPHTPFFHDSATTALAFDEAAAEYDKDFTKTQTGRIQRDIVHRYISSNIDPYVYKNVLEINCGTGEDALWLSARGHKVIATDASSKMIEIANTKLKLDENAGAVQFEQLPFSKLKELKSQQFDMVFSNFGGLNCASPDEIKIIAADISQLLRPGGKFIAVLMGRNCILEKLYFTFKGDKKNRSRRKSLQPVKANVSSNLIDINYYSPEEFSKLLSPSLSLVAFRPVGLFVPPSFLEKPFTAIPGVSTSAKILERFAGIHPGWSDYADHYLIELTRKMKILLTHAYYLNEDPKELLIMKPYVPLGILYISAYLEEHNFVNEVFDATFSDFDSHCKRLIEFQPDVVAVYTNLMTKLNVLRLIRFIKGEPTLKHTKVILGGPEVRHHAANFLRHGADFIVMGEGEETMLELVKAIAEEAENFSSIPGIGFISGEEQIFNESRTNIRDINTLPFPARKKVNLQLYFDAWKNRHGESAISVSTMRGCPYTCKWCSRAVYGQSYRRRSPALVAEELQWIQKNYKVDTVWFVDDVFTISHKWLNEFNEELKKINLKVKYECITRADRMNEEVLRLLKETGCYRVWIGAESGSQKIIDAMDRRVDVQQVREMIRKSKDFGIQSGTFIMIGYPGETEADLVETLHHLKSSNPDYYTITVAYPIKGTPLYIETEPDFTIKPAWDEGTDRQIDFKRNYSRKYYDYAIRWIANEMAHHKNQVNNGPFLKSAKHALKAAAARGVMRVVR